MRYFLAILSLIPTATGLFADDLARVTTTVSQEVVAGGVDIETPTMVVVPKQGIILVDGIPTLPSVASEQTLSIYDKRGTLSPITVSVTVSPLTNGDHVRDMSLEPISFGGENPNGIQGKRVETNGSTVTEPQFITAPPDICRVFEATVEMAVEELTGKEAVSGAWTGQITYTVN